MCKPNEPIDAVYLWVDGQAPGFAESLASALADARDAPDPGSVTSDRFRDNGELRYSLRSLEKYASWIRHVYIVTNGQVPVWLDTTHERLRIVTHDQLFERAENLPTFNSHAIEMQLHRIPDLSRRFLYLNDDVFFGRPSDPADFVVDRTAQRIYLQETPLWQDADHGHLHDRACAYTRALMGRYWRFEPGEQRLPAHAPQLYDREIIADLIGKLAGPAEQTAQHRFRTPRDVVLRILYLFYQTEITAGRDEHETVVLQHGGPDYMFVMLQTTGKYTVDALELVGRTGPRFFCINDDLGDAGSEHTALCAVRYLLARMFPEKSSFERTAPSPTAVFQREMWNQRLRTNWGPHGVGSLAYGHDLNKWFYRVRRSVFRRAVKRLGLDVSKVRILDAGSGTGFYLREWRALGATNLAGIDLSDVAVARLRGSFPDADIYRANVCDLPGPLEGEKYDVITAMDLLFHVIDDDDYARAVTGLSRLLNAGGYLIFSENLLSDRSRAHENYWKSRARKDIEKLLSTNGLDILSIRPIFILMGSPVDTKSERPAQLWDALMRWAHRHQAGGLLGSIMYPLERALLMCLSRGPSTKLVVCRKRRQDDNPSSASARHTGTHDRNRAPA